MKKWIYFALFYIAAAYPPTAAAVPYYFGEPEVLLPSNADDGFKKETKVLVRGLAAAGYSSAWKLDTESALGGRLGVMFPAGSLGDLGLSAGYIAGPVSKLTLTTGGKIFEFKREVRFRRILAEYRKEYPMGEYWSFVPGCAAGLAFGRVEMKTGEGMDSKVWSGLSWDISARFLRRMTKLDMYFAVKYAGFPKFDKDESKGLPKMNWEAIGFSVGLAFGGRPVPSSVYSHSDHEDRKDYGTSVSESVPQAVADDKPAAEYEDEPFETYEDYIAFAKESFSQGDYRQAVISYNEALASLPDGDERAVGALERIGLSLLKQGRYKQAGDVYISAVKTGKGLGLNNTEVVNAYLGLAYCLQKEGNFKWAVANYKAAWKRTPNPQTRRKIEEALADIRKNGTR